MKPVFLFVAIALAIGAPAYAQTPTAGAPEVQVPLPDVRGLEYRKATLATAFPRSPWATIETNKVRMGHFWILPGKGTEKARGIDWNGVIYDLQSVGAPASWREDAQRGLQPPKLGVEPVEWGFSSQAVARFYLDQLGAPELAKQIPLSLIELGGMASARPTDRMLRVWRQNLRQAGLIAFSRQQFDEAKRAFETILASTRGDRTRNEERVFLADIARRQKDVPQPTEEIAGLIWNLQNARVTYPGDMGGIAWQSSPEIQKVMAVGERAVDALIDTLEKDERLTLSLSGNRSGDSQVGSIGTVRHAVFYLIQAIMHRYYDDKHDIDDAQGRAAIITNMRADRAKLKR